MNEDLSIGTDIACEPDVTLCNPTDTDESVPVDIKLLSADPKSVGCFREQLKLQKSSKEEGTVGFLTDADNTENDGSASSLKPGTGGFYAKSAVKSDVKSPIPPSKTFKSTNGGTTVPESVMFREPVEKTPLTSSVPSRPLPKHAALLREQFETSSQTSRKGTSNVPVLNTETENIASSSNRRSLLHSGKHLKFETMPSLQSPSQMLPNDASAVLFSKTKKSEHSRLSESTVNSHGTATIDAIPFLRTSTDNTVPVPETTAAQASKLHATLIAQQIRDHIIDRILISSSDLNTNRTVTIQLSPQLLRDTEVQFTQNGTSLDIRLGSQNKDSVQFLQQHQSDLQTYLQGELKTYRTISVRVPSSQASAELSQPHDGRSRNRFEYQSTDEEETA